MSVRSMLACGVTMAALLAPAGVYAQTTTAATASDDADAIIVTGSRIRQNPLNQDSPVVVVDSESIARTGLSSVADVLQRLPSASGGLNSKVNASGNLGNPPDGGGVGAGSAEIELRYLAAKRTLVLVDGLRFVNGTSASGIPSTVDLNTIPANSIERIEVLQSGASPLYGSDAIAGVVNIITKASQEGLQASAQFGTFRQGDGHSQDYQLSYGVKGDRVSVVVGGSYVKQEAVRSADRSISQYPNPGQTACSNGGGGCSSAAANGRFLGDFGNLTISNAPNDHPTLADLRPFTTADRFNFAPYQYILTPSERYGAFVSAKYEVSDNVNFRLKALYNRRNSQNQAAFEPLFLGPDAGNGAGSLFDTISIDKSNPYNPFGYTLQSGVNADGSPNGQTKNYSFIARRLIEAGQRTFTQHVDTLSATATLDGSFDVGAHKWFWDTSAVIGFNDAKQTFTGNVNAAKVQQALGPLSACTAPCVPLNLFGGAGSITPDQLAFITFTEHDRSSQSMADFTANLSGDIFDLPAGPVGFAVGYEHRIQSASFNPDPIVAAGLGADIPAAPASGKYNSDEIYGEIRVPLLKDAPFFHSLEATGAVRHSNYSIGGSATTYTGTGLWKPVADILLRGSYATGFRAPSIGELFGGRTRYDSNTADPCSNIPGSAYQTNPTVKANCLANGVPATYAEDPGQLPVITQGNKNLQPEKSRSLLFGGVYAPAWARDSGFASSFSIEANYYDIRVNNAIGSVDAALVLDNCYARGDAASCSQIVRTGAGFVQQINGTLQNLDSISTKGVDLMVNYRSPASSVGSFGLSLNGTWLTKYVLSASNGFLVIDRLGTERGSPDQAYPKFKGNGTVDWTLGDFGASFTGRYIDSVIEVDGSGNTLKSRFYGDIQLRYSPSALKRRVTLTLGVNNVFNQDPPGCFSCSVNNFDPTTYDVPGQFGYLRIAYKM